MAATFGAALAKVAGPKFYVATGYEVIRPEPAPVDEEVQRALESRGYDALIGWVARAVGRRLRVQLADAQEATHDAYAEMLEEHREQLCDRDFERLRKRLYWRAYYRLKEVGRDARQVDSIERIREADGDATLAGARPCVPLRLGSAGDCRAERFPSPREEWNARQIVGAFQCFCDYYRRPPRVTDCAPARMMPSSAAVRRCFGDFDGALLAAGMITRRAGRRRSRAWGPDEGARACRSFRSRNLRWPDGEDARRRPGELPNPRAMVRLFGGTCAAEIGQGAESILAAARSAG